MEFQMIEQSAFDEMKTLVTTLRERAERFRELFSPPQPRRWLTAEEVCKALRITKRTLQYYRSEGIIPSTSLGNKILYKESDIARILQNNLIAPSKKWTTYSCEPRRNTRCSGRKYFVRFICWIHRSRPIDRRSSRKAILPAKR